MLNMCSDEIMDTMCPLTIFSMFSLCFCLSVFLRIFWKLFSVFCNIPLLVPHWRRLCCSSIFGHSQPVMFLSSSRCGSSLQSTGYSMLIRELLAYRSSRCKVKVIWALWFLLVLFYHFFDNISLQQCRLCQWCSSGIFHVSCGIFIFRFQEV